VGRARHLPEVATMDLDPLEIVLICSAAILSLLTVALPLLV
jgi:hypothetical protein